ncbi:MAG: hypothetical protein B6245_01785 [Desulfobacteraceae bacterium 4572_88]|nr:MAG: hypothetical protein B6245_01785 [Desulfobacteraceae bacterium 4572_88]
MKILVIDDQATVRKAMCIVLRKLGFSDITEADSGNRAMACLDKKQFDLVISDMHMPAPDSGGPAKSGLDVLQYVKTHPRLKDTPFLMVTTDAEMKTIVQAMQRGVNGYIVKPFTEASVKEKLDMLGFLANAAA